MSWRTRILWFVAVLVGLGLAGAFALRWALAPARIEARVERAFAAATGLPLELTQPPRLSLLPRIALDLGSGRVGEGAEPLLEWTSLRVDAGAMSLLRGEPELGRLELDGLRLRLRRDAAGRGNWEAALAQWRERVWAGAGAVPGADAESSGVGDGLRLAGAVLTNASIDYHDARDPGAALSLTGLALRAGAWVPGEPLALEGRFAVQRAGRPLATLSHASLTLVDAGHAGWRVDALALRGRARLASSGAGRATAGDWPFELDVPQLDIEPGHTRAAAAGVMLRAGPARLQLSSLRVEWPESAPLRAAGAFALDELAPRELLAALGLAVPRTRDAGALSRGSAQGQLAWDGQRLRVEPLALVLDDTRFAGRVGWDGVLEFALQGDALDVDRYREPPDPAAERFVFPGEAFAAWQARGTLSLARARVEGVELEDVTLRLVLDTGARGGAAAGDGAGR